MKQKQYNRVHIFPSTIGTGTIGHTHAKEMNLDTNLIPFTKINTKCIRDLNVKCKTIKLLEYTIDDFGYGDTFFR